MTSYWLGIDLGTTYTAAAICWPGADGLEVQVVPLSSHSHAIPSVLFLPGDGSLVVGEGAQRRSLTDPDRVVREFKSRVGDEIPLLVGGSAFYAHDLAAEFVGWLYHYVVDREGEAPEAVALTCPASWGPYKTGLFKRAVEDAGVPNVMVLSEPQAAAVSYASRERAEVGATLAVYDLGGGTFDAAVVRKDSPGQFTVLGQPEGLASLGGLGFDELIFEHVCAAAGVPIDELDPNDPDLASEVARLRRECTEAKEALSADTDVTIPVALGDIRQRVRLTRAEFEEMIRPDLDRTIDALHRALATAQVEPGGLDAILLIGGSSRIPLVSQLVAAEFGRAPAIDTDPKVAVAMGAARFLAPASAPVRDTLETEVQLPLDSAPPERPEMASMLDAGDEEEGGWAKPSQRPSRRVLAGAAALVVLVVAGGVTALRTPMLSDLLSHHGTTHGTTVSSGASPGTGGSPAPSAQSSARATGTARAGTTRTGATGTGPAASVASSKAAAKAGGKSGGTSGSTGGKGGTGQPPVTKTTPPVVTPTTTAPVVTPTTPVVTPTTPVATPTTPAATTGTGQGALPDPSQSAPASAPPSA
jgi:actin-like ATPase involved in cell morphogenesis